MYETIIWCNEINDVMKTNCRGVICVFFFFFLRKISNATDTRIEDREKLLQSEISKLELIRI